MATLTPEIAQQLMYQSSTGGVPTAELNKYGGYDAVRAAAQNSGYSPTPEWIAGYEKSSGLPASDYTIRNTPAAGNSGSVGGGNNSSVVGNSGSVGGGNNSSVVGYSGLGNATRANLDMASIFEKTTGRPVDSSIYDESDPDYESNMATLQRISNALYGDIGANLDARDWKTILASDDPLKAAEDGLKAMYSDKAYLQANAQYVLEQGYLPEQADFTYKQMQGRVGSTYDPNWAKGSKFEGAYDTNEYINALKRNDPTIDSRLWQRWGGNPTLKNSSGGSNNSGLIGNALTDPTLVNISMINAGNANTGNANTGVVYGPDGKMYSSVAAAIAAGVTNYTTQKPIVATSGQITSVQPSVLQAGAVNQIPMASSTMLQAGGSTKTAAVQPIMLQAGGGTNAAAVQPTMIQAGANGQTFTVQPTMLQAGANGQTFAVQPTMLQPSNAGLISNQNQNLFSFTPTANNPFKLV